MWWHTSVACGGTRTNLEPWTGWTSYRMSSVTSCCVHPGRKSCELKQLTLGGWSVWLVGWCVASLCLCWYLNVCTSSFTSWLLLPPSLPPSLFVMLGDCIPSNLMPSRKQSFFFFYYFLLRRCVALLSLTSPYSSPPNPPPHPLCLFLTSETYMLNYACIP